MHLAAGERRDLADLLASLTPEQWEHPSLCDGWTVRDVAAHVVSYDELGAFGVARAFLGGGFRPDRINALRLHAYRHYEPDQLVAVLRAHPEPRGLTAGMGGGIGLSDCLIHHQDIRRPLGLPRTVPPDRLAESLGIALRAPVLPARRNARGLRLIATDLDWKFGSGPQICGPGEALLLAITGRPAALNELTGPGTDTLRTRVDGAGS